MARKNTKDELIKKLIKQISGKLTEKDELIPEVTYGVPVADWECRYCQYYSICPSTLADKKPKY